MKQIQVITIPPVRFAKKQQNKKIAYFNKFLSKLKYGNLILIDLYASIKPNLCEYLNRYSWCDEFDKEEDERNKLETIDDSAESEIDEVEVQGYNTDSSLSAASGDEENTPVILVHQRSTYLGKDNQTIWYVHSNKQKVMENLNIGLLIELVNGYVYLFDKGHKSYKDLVIKENAWLEVALTLNSTPETCKNAFLSLKEKYIRERKKMKNIPRGSSVAKWVWYDIMSFLDPHIQQRSKTTTNFVLNKEAGCSGSSETTVESDGSDGNTIFSDDHFDDTLTMLTQIYEQVEYINLMAIKYRSSAHHYKMIRNKMRHLGRILLEMNKNDKTINDISSIFQPCKFDKFIKTINSMAGLAEGKFNAPSLGPTSITLMRKMGAVIESFAIKNGNKEMQVNVENFLILLHTMGNPLVSKVAQENRTQLQRSKKIILPKIEDIYELYNKHRLEITKCTADLKNEFKNDIWVRLSKATLVHIIIFNRKRPGDVERSQILEYQNLERVFHESLKSLNNYQRQIANQYARYITRGKLNSPAPLLVSELDMSAIQIILQYRRDAKIPNDNPYLFAHPPGTTNKFFSGGLALQNFCYENKLQNKNLTATKLRKHLATVTGTFEQEKIQIVRETNNVICTDNLHNNEEDIIDDLPAPGPSVPHLQMFDTVDVGDTLSSELHKPVHSGNDSNYSDQLLYQPDLSTIVEGSASDESNDETTRFNKECAKLRSKPSGCSREVIKIKLWCFEQLLFLQDQCTPRGSISNLPRPEGYGDWNDTIELEFEDKESSNDKQKMQHQTQRQEV
ncbi:hypothetical protein RN001_003696 [Aquatica leii]|uniref:MADF domain-containing protein n=1 Tax=Aquatica leii TaxID=1421715 RepID=A0AAN7PFG3_9COLE|nr:hypothetical protein RN001_003696 [Aquatica leii]